MKVLISDLIHEDGVKKLKEFADVEIATRLNERELIDKIPEFEVMIVRSATRVSKEVLEAAENLRLIVRAGAGLDNIDLDTAEERNIKVENTPEALTTAAAELTIGLMLAWNRNISEADMALRKGKWIKHQLTGNELRGKTLGIIGTGRIGREVAKRAKAFEMELIGYDLKKSAKFRSLGGKYVDFNKLIRESDYITLHVPCVPSTEKMISEKQFKMMKPTAVIVNTARGPIIDEKELIKAIRNNDIAGACLDVYEKEPLKDSPLMDLPNIIMTPHIGASTEEAQRDVGLLTARKVKENIR